MPIEKNDDVDYHDKLCYYLVHATKRRREFGLVHDRMLNKKKERIQFTQLFWGSLLSFESILL